MHAAVEPGIDLLSVSEASDTVVLKGASPRLSLTESDSQS